MEWYTTDCGKYRIECLSARTFPGALDLIRREFCQEEPVNIGTEVNKNPAAIEELLLLCAYAALDGASLVAVETSTGGVAAIIFNKLQFKESNGSEKPFFEMFAEAHCTQPSFRALVQFMVDVDKRYNMFDIYGIDCSLEMMFLATHFAHRRQKLAFLLCKYTLELARSLKHGPVAHMTLKDLGPKYSNVKPRDAVVKHPKICQSLATSTGSQKVLKSLGFTTHFRLPLRESSFNDKRYTERVGYECFCEIMSKPLFPDCSFVSHL